MSEEFYQYYAAAPVIVWIVTDDADDLKAKLKEYNAASIIVKGNEDDIGEAF